MRSSGGVSSQGGDPPVPAAHTPTLHRADAAAGWNSLSWPTPPKNTILSVITSAKEVMFFGLFVSKMMQKLARRF